MDSDKFDLCVVEWFLTEKGINTRAIKSKLADIWRPFNIKDIKASICLFQFHQAEDIA